MGFFNWPSVNVFTQVVPNVHVFTNVVVNVPRTRIQTITRNAQHGLTSAAQQGIASAQQGFVNAQERLSPILSSAKNTAIETAEAFRDDVDTAAGAVKEVFDEVAEEFTEAAKELYDDIREEVKAILDKYPPVKVFVYSFAGAAALPFAVFVAAALMLAIFMLTIAIIIMGAIQSGFFALGGFILFWFLCGAVGIASFLTFWFSLGYFTLEVNFIQDLLNQNLKVN
jgi:gas vesicle protein